jgi:TRAP-type C4-dicarboxylate transport system permease small subunit
VLVATIMFGACEAYRRHDHIAIDILSGRVKGKAVVALQVLSHLAVLAFSVVLGTSTWDAIAFARSFGSYTTGNVSIQSWIPQTPMLVGAVLLGLMAAARLAGTFVKPRRA